MQKDIFYIKSKFFFWKILIQNCFEWCDTCRHLVTPIQFLACLGLTVKAPFHIWWLFWIRYSARYLGGQIWYPTGYFVGILQGISCFLLYIRYPARDILYAIGYLLHSLISSILLGISCILPYTCYSIGYPVCYWISGILIGISCI